MSVSTDHPRSPLLWAAWIATALFIPVLSGLGRRLQHWAYDNLGETLAAWIIGLTLFTLASLALNWLRRRGSGAFSLKLILLSVALLAIFIAILVLLPRTEERLHFVTFGLFGFFSLRVMPLPLAVALVMLWSGGDELWQAWLPDRVGDWRDVWMNLAAGVIGMALAAPGRPASSRTGSEDARKGRSV